MPDFVIDLQNDKFCKECKWFISGKDSLHSTEEYARCMRAVKPGYYVDGDKRKKDNFCFCSIERGFTSGCGPKAKYFEPLEIIIDVAPAIPLMIEGPKKSFTEKVSAFAKKIFK